MRGAAILFVALLAGAGFADAAEVHGSAPPHRVLIVYDADSTLGAAIEIARGLRAGLNEHDPTGYEVYTEFLDSARFPEAASLERMARYIEAKYRDRKPDAVMAAGPGAFSLLMDRRDEIMPDVPLFFGAITEASFAERTLPPDVKGVVSRFDVRETLAFARSVQPRAKHAVIVTGSSPFDQGWQDTARAALDDNYEGFDIRYLSGLSLQGFSEALSRLPPQAAVVILSVYEDSEGKQFVPREAAAVLASASAAPVYTVYDTYIAKGVLGGYVSRFYDAGKQLGTIVRRALEGDTDVPQRTVQVTNPVADWRELERFGISESLLPPNTEIRFRPRSLWNDYRTEILITIAALVLQSAMIVALIIQAHRRKVAESELAKGRLELAHLSRASMLGELSGAFAHELNQPLTAILANAQVGKQLLDTGRADTQELGEILADIVADDKRAAAVIGQIRRLLTKGEAVLERIDLNQVTSATLALARSELLARQTKVDFAPAFDSVFVFGNASQIQQVVLNLLMNAVDATAHLSSRDREVKIGVRKCGRWAELLVTDNGHGLTADMITDAFKPFVSTKPKGLGLGLSICNSIVKAHGGKLRFNAERGTGAEIVLSLPLEGKAS